jgi:formylglycine-generating enzyme required for sulfatase activity
MQNEKRVALVVGNGAYDNTSPLTNPPNDAAGVAAALSRLDFEVLNGNNLGFANFAGRIRDFGRALREAHVALFFYAGHGLQVKGENYVVPVDAALEHEADVQLELIAVQTILAQMEVGNRTSLVILDACRDNPLARNLARAMGAARSTAIGDGLGGFEGGRGTYIAFATAPNKLALDGATGGNSPFTAALLRHIEEPGLTIHDVMMRVRQDVIKATETFRQGPQVPWENHSLTAHFYFKRADASAQQPPVLPNPAIVTGGAEKDWEQFEIADTENVAIIEAYIAQYEKSERLWALRARQRLEVILALIAERERAGKEAEEKRRRDEEREAQYRAKGFVKVEALGDGHATESRWIEPGSGESFRDFGEGPEMVIVPAGEFMMGSTDDEIVALTKQYGDYFKREGPRHRVVISKPFAIGRYAVTFAEWDAFIAAGGGDYRPEDQGWGRSDRPAIDVSWNDIQSYLAWLKRLTNQDYRLPSEAEWEYAARAGSQTPFWWGSSISTIQANYDGNHVYGDGAKGEYRKKTLPAKSFDPNPWGLYQVHGNVWEWCEDGWHDSYAGKPEALKINGGAWTTEGGGARVLRGGSWVSSPNGLRSAYRNRNSPDFRYFNFGFRVARTLTS